MAARPETETRREDPLARATDRTGSLLTLALCTLFAGLAIWLYLGAGRDDMFLTLWAGEHLGSAPWFVNHNYELEEISSSVLHALVIALLSLVSPEVFIANKLFGLACSVGSMVAIYRLRREIFGDGDLSSPLAVSAIALTVGSPAFLYWTMGGLETALQSLILLLYCGAFLRCARVESARSRDLVALAGVQILYVLVRSEGFWLVFLNAALLVPLLSVRGFQRRYVFTFLVPAAFALGLIAVRHHFTGLAFPNPTYAKVADLDESARQGIRYLRRYHRVTAFSHLHLVALAYAAFNLATTGVAILRRDTAAISRRFPAMVVSAVAIVSDAFAVAVGGNWMEYFRFMVPAIVLKNALLALLLGDLLTWLRNRPYERPARAALALTAAGAVALALYQHVPSRANRSLHSGSQSTRLSLDVLMDGSGQRVRRIENLNRATRLTRENTETFIADEMPRYLEASGHLTVLSHQAGAFPYLIRQHFGADEVAFIDSMGLASKFVAVIPGARTSFGIATGAELSEILSNQSGRLSREILAREPNLAYTGGLADDERQALAPLGWEVVWEREHAVMIWRPEGQARAALRAAESP